MKNICKLFSITLLLLLLTSCTSMTNKSTPISDNEYTQLVQFAKTTIGRLPSSKISSSDKTYIDKTQPTKIANYTGYKQGKITLSWEFPNGKQVKYVAKGDIMDFSSSFRSVNIFDVSVSSSIQRQH